MVSSVVIGCLRQFQSRHPSMQSKNYQPILGLLRASLILVSLAAKVESSRVPEDLSDSIPIVLGRHVNLTSTINFHDNRDIKSPLEETRPASDFNIRPSSLPAIGDHSLLLGSKKSFRPGNNETDLDRQAEQLSTSLEKPSIEGK